MAVAAPSPCAAPRPLSPRRTALRLERPEAACMREFLAAVERSRKLHHPWVAPPDTRAAFRTWLERIDDGSYEGHLVRDEAGELVGAVNVGEIVRGAFQSGHLGYYAFAPHAGRGLMGEAVRRVVTRAFRDYGLNRLEANIQPANLASRALVARLGFRLEGYSPRYLKIGGRWRDHERWALTAGDWRRRRST